MPRRELRRRVRVFAAPARSLFGEHAVDLELLLIARPARESVRCIRPGPGSSPRCSRKHNFVVDQVQKDSASFKRLGVTFDKSLDQDAIAAIPSIVLLGEQICT